MCTLTFIPSHNSCVITSNRDEHVSRANTKFPVIKTSANGQIFFPQDPLAGGTWLAADTQNRVTVLLNGAFEKHNHRPPYRLSRGIVLLDSFDHPDLHAFNEAYDFTNIEPFTMVQFNLFKKEIHELRWDETQCHYTTLNFEQPHIWSSATLYSLPVRNQRQQWFDQWVTQQKTSPLQMVEFHKFGGAGDDNSITMNRGNGLKTVSISQLISRVGAMQFSHHNLITNNIEHITI